uniref:Uncharacterized protein n=1 Tax=Sphaerodactylus townsendi TaxID=933632 RepID=A0ACB8ERJ2_9SAUR
MSSERRSFDATLMRLIFLSWSVALNLLTTSARNVSYEAGEPKRVWAEEGGRAVLPCYLNPQKLESSLGELYKRLSIRWEWRGRSSTQVHHMVLQVAASGLKTRARSMMPRASVQDKDFLHGDFSLQIKPATREDVGRYSARVKYGSKAHHCELKLDVVSGQSLFISRSISSDSGPWVCELTYAGGERVSVTHHLQVLGFAGPTWPVVYAATGTNIYLPCILNFNPLDYDNSKVAVRWSHVAGDDLKAKSNQHQGTNKNLALYLPAVGPDSAGQYFCAVSINGTTISKNVTLVIMTVIPSIEGPVLEGSHLVLTCNLSHAPGKVHFQWKWLGPEPSNSSKAAFKSSEHLTTGWIREFSKVSPEDSGIWECSIHSAEGRLGSVQYHLEIAGAQVASPAQNMMPEEITYGLISFLFALVVSVAVLILLWHRTRSLNIPALDRLVAAAHLRKEFKDAAQKEKVLQTEP